MFDVDIGMKAYEGIKLHRKDGTEYWKLRLTCTQEECPNEIEMGECLCFGTEEAMIHARDDHGMHCSAKCWVDDHDEETVAKEAAEARKALGEMDGDEWSYFVDDMSDDILVIAGYWEYIADEGCYDGADWLEDYDVEECPI